MDEHNTIYNNNEKRIGHFRHGVAWRVEPRERLGEYYEDRVLSNERELLARIIGNRIVAPSGLELGYIESTESETDLENSSVLNLLHVGGKIVGRCIGSHEAAGAAIVFLGEELAETNT